jgi:hypothetical protein
MDKVIPDFCVLKSKEDYPLKNLHDVIINSMRSTLRSSENKSKSFSMSVRIGYEGFDFPEADAKSRRGNWANMLCWFPKKDWKGDGDCGGFIVFLNEKTSAYCLYSEAEVFQYLKITV